MKPSTAPLLLVLPLLALWPQDPPADVRSLVSERASAARSLGLEELWEEARRLADLSLDLEEPAVERALDELLAAGQLDPRAVLLLVAARLDADDPDPDALCGSLLPLLESADESVLRGVAGLLCDPEFQRADPELTDRASAALLQRARAAALAPATRLELAVAAWQRGGGTGKRDARRELQAFLGSSDSALRSLAALSLARIGDLETARTELERLQRLPGTQGQLARAYLDADEKVRIYETRLRRQRESYDGLLGQTTLAKDVDRVERLIALIQSTHLEGHLVEREDLLSAALDGMLRSIDPHSGYMPPKAYESFEQDLQAEYGGIGAYVGVDRSDNLFTITQPIYDGPAYKAGLRTDDKIVRIEDWPTFENGVSKDQDEIIRRLKGKPGTTVRLYVWQRGMDPALIDRPSEEMAVEVVRAMITIPPLKADLLPGGIGLVELSTFSNVASQQLASTLREMVATGVSGIVLDLRNNPGGLLREARNVADLFLPKDKLVVKTESRIEAPELLHTRTPPLVPEDLPVVVLVNRFSASASEIVAGALQDHGRATIVGQRSFGKGSVQNLITMPGERDDEFRDENRNNRHDDWERLTRDWNQDGKFDFAPRVKLTIARYVLPSGRSIHREFDKDGNQTSPGGVEPDHDVQPARWDTWRLEEARRINTGRDLRQWVETTYPLHRELLTELAYGDQADPSRYPGFEALYESLRTTLPRQDVRFLLRAEVRRRVQDDRGSAFPQGDFQEDTQLQKAIELVLGAQGRKVSEVEAYATVFRLAESTADGAAAELADAGERARRAGLSDALALLDEARRSDGQLAGEKLEELARILTGLER